MEKSGQLMDMRAVAQFVDCTILELEAALTSVDDLKPSEEYEPEAMKIMSEMVQEIKAVAEHATQLKDTLRKQLEASQKELEQFTAANNAMEDEISQIEGTLKNYGYDSTRMPAYVSDNTVDEDSLIVTSSQSDCSSASSMETFSKVEYPTPGMNRLSESLASVEITPLVLSSKSGRIILHSDSPVLNTPLSKNVLKLPDEYALGGNPYIIGSRSPSPTHGKHPNTGEAVIKSQMPVKPQPPILSKATYELLGEDPPPEFFSEHNNL